MAYNMPTVTSKNLTFGPGVLYVGASGTTPTVDVGAVDGSMKITMKRTALELEQGSPATLVEKFCIKEECEIEFTGLEINLQNLQRSLGGGAYSSGSKYFQLDLGGDMNFTDVALKFVHQTAAGNTVTVSVWKANGSGEGSMDFGSNEWLKAPMKFSGVYSATDWAGATLVAGKQLVKIRYDTLT